MNIEDELDLEIMPYEELVVETKKRKIVEFLNENSHRAKQGTPEWLEERRMTIGGSELATILGQNPYSTVKDLVAEKIGFKRFQGNIYTLWGKVFEDVTERLVKIMFSNNEDIYSAGSIPSKEVPNFKFSPDGITIIEYRDSIQNKSKKITLLEFKSPMRRIPDNKIPKYYESQVMSGMCAIDICEIGLYVSNLYRKCAVKDLGPNPVYDRGFHSYDGKKITDNDLPLAYGVIMVYLEADKVELFISEHKQLEFHDDQKQQEAEPDLFDNNQSETKDILDLLHRMVDTNTNTPINDIFNIELIPNLDKPIIDLGQLPEDQISVIFKLIEKGILTTDLRSPTIIKDNLLSKNCIIPDELAHCINPLEPFKTYSYYGDSKSIINRFSKVKKYTPIGVLPWKLFKSSTILRKKDASYLLNCKSKIDEVIQIVAGINKSDDIEQEYNKVFNPDDRFDLFD